MGLVRRLDRRRGIVQTLTQIDLREKESRDFASVKVDLLEVTQAVSQSVSQSAVIRRALWVSRNSIESQMISSSAIIMVVLRILSHYIRSAKLLCLLLLLLLSAASAECREQPQISLSVSQSVISLSGSMCCC